MDIIDNVKADTLEEGDIIQIGGSEYEILSVSPDPGDLDYVIVRIENGEDLPFSADEYVDIYGYVSVEI